MTLRQVGSAVGIALLGSLLANVFRDRLDVTGLPAEAAGTAGDSVVAAHLVAEKAGPGEAARLAASANGAYVHGMGVILLVCGIAALVSALLAAAFLPNSPVVRRTEREEAPVVAAPAGDAGQ
ncbi:hypothetical protein Scel_36570 [Streptomyces cellostaticus]|nr:hypothetical protein Scel_36570 [Streptomyces cellostaticus]